MERFTPQTMVMFLQVFEISGGGGDIYHSFGDDESVPEEERELGIFAMPFVGCDTVAAQSCSFLYCREMYAKGM